MIIFHIDKKSSIPIYKQIIDHIIKFVEKGILKNNDVLPSSRRLAEKLDVSRYTVIHAYEELWALGYLQSNVGSYTKIRKRPEIVSISEREKPKINYNNVIAKHIKNTINSINKDISIQTNNITNDYIDMSEINLESKLFPLNLFKKSINKVLNSYPPSIFNYGEIQGYKPLREYISKRMQHHSIDIMPEEILISNGCTQAIELITKLFTNYDDYVIIESPTYKVAINIFKMFNLNMLEIPMTMNGMDLNILEEVLSKHNDKKPKFIYTIPSFHNPTGITTSQTHREELLSLCNRFEVPLIEDCFEEEIKYFNKVVLSIKSMDKYQLVFYLGSFSKVLFPGIRIGWVAGEKECINKLSLIKKNSDISSNTFNQAALYDFCNEGYYEAYIKKINKTYSKKMNLAIQSMYKYIPDDKVNWINPSGGYLIWLKLKNTDKSENDIYDICMKNGVKVSMGSAYYSTPNDEKYIRICISLLNEEQIIDGIKKLGKSIETIYK